MMPPHVIRAGSLYNREKSILAQRSLLTDAPYLVLAKLLPKSKPALEKSSRLCAGKNGVFQCRGDFAMVAANAKSTLKQLTKFVSIPMSSQVPVAPPAYLPSGSAFALWLGSYDVWVFCKKPVWQFE